jgi:hypothetical protein
VFAGLFNAFSQTITLRAGEGRIAFIQRHVPKGLSFHKDLAEQMIESNEWSTTKSFVAFYKLTYKLPNDDMEYEDILGYLYVPINKSNVYRRVLIDTIECEGGKAQIISIFFANADKDNERELVVLIDWPVQHYQIYGNFYETRIYDNLPGNSLLERLPKLSKVGQKVSGGFDGDREEETVKARYKTAKEIREGLKKLGY